MANKRRVMSDALKMECAKELGIYDVVQQTGDFGEVSSRNCGNLVTKAIEIANRSTNG